MKCVIKTQITHVIRSEFTNANGDKVPYCKFDVIENVFDSENEYGYVISSISSKVDNFPKLLAYAKQKQDINLEIEFVTNKDGSIKRKVTKINNDVLV